MDLTHLGAALGGRNENRFATYTYHHAGASTAMNERPAEGEYNPYYGMYIGLVPDGHIVETLRDQFPETLSVLKGISEERAGFRYAPGKWSVKELLGHLMDAERVFVYRALCIARGDTQSLPGFSEDDYARAANFDAVPFANLVAEVASVRDATVRFFSNLSDEAWKRQGTANGSGVSVRAVAYILAGHERHHRSVLRDRYLSGTAA